MWNFKDWKFKGPYVDFSRDLKIRNKKTAPVRLVVMICWVVVGVAILFAFLKIVFRVI